MTNSPVVGEEAGGGVGRSSLSNAGPGSSWILLISPGGVTGGGGGGGCDQTLAPGWRGSEHMPPL